MKKQKNFLFADDIIPLVKDRLSVLQPLLQQKLKALSSAPKGSLRIIKNHGTQQYYHITENGDRNGKYISKENIELAKALAQRDYDKKIVSLLSSQIDALNVFCADYKPFGVDQLLESIPQNRLNLIQSTKQVQDEYIKEWQLTEYVSLPFSEKDPELFSANGKRVRSKSEVIIADALTRENIPFRYEFPVRIKLHTAIVNAEGLGNSIIIHPDFYCLNPRTGKEFIWEHFGLMDNSDYAAKSIAKLNNYALNGWRLGQNLIATFETSQTPLNHKIITDMIETYLV